MAAFVSSTGPAQNDDSTIFNNLKEKGYTDGLQYIRENKLQNWLERQINNDKITELELLWQIFYENNIYKEDVNLNTAGTGKKSTMDMNAGKGTRKKRSKPRKKRGTIQNKKKKLLKGGNPNLFKKGWNALSILTLNDPAGTKIYGSSLPINNGLEIVKNPRLKNTTRELYEHFRNELKIDTIISFQNCETTKDSVHRMDCISNKFYDGIGSIYSQQRVWESLGGKFIATEIKDMTAGSLDNFNVLINNKVSESPTLISCLAGFGRTGSALLYYWFRTQCLYGITESNGFRSTINWHYAMLQEPFLKTGSSRYMYTSLKNNFEKCLTIHTDEVIEQSIHVSNIINELFKINTLNLANLFVARINYILLYTELFINAETDKAKYPGLPVSPSNRQIYLYPLHTDIPFLGFNSINIFQTPVLVDTRTYIHDNNFGIKEHNIPYTGKLDSQVPNL